MPECKAYGCTNKAWEGSCKSKSFFRIPFPSPGRVDLTRKWLRAMGKNVAIESVNFGKHCLMCEDHFEKTCFLEDETHTGRMRKRLRPGSFPTIYSEPPLRLSPGRAPSPKDLSSQTSNMYQGASLHAFTDQSPSQSNSGNSKGKKQDEQVFQLSDGTFQKLPAPPKKALSPYMYFQLSKRGDMLKADTSLTFSTVAGKVSEAWKALSPQDKVVYTQMYKQDYARYKEEKRIYDEKLFELQKKGAVITTKPSMIKSPFEIFKDTMERNSPLFMSQGPDVYRLKCIQDMWKGFTAEEKKIYVDIYYQQAGHQGKLPAPTLDAVIWTPTKPGGQTGTVVLNTPTIIRQSHSHSPPLSVTPPGAKPDTDTLQGLLSAGSSDVDSDSDIPQKKFKAEKDDEITDCNESPVQEKTSEKLDFKSPFDIFQARMRKNSMLFQITADEFESVVEEMWQGFSQSEKDVYIKMYENHKASEYQMPLAKSIESNTLNSGDRISRSELPDQDVPLTPPAREIRNSNFHSISVDIDSNILCVGDTLSPEQKHLLKKMVAPQLYFEVGDHYGNPVSQLLDFTWRQGPLLDYIKQQKDHSTTGFSMCTFVDPNVEATGQGAVTTSTSKSVNGNSSKDARASSKDARTPGKDTRTPGKETRTPSKDTRTPSKDARVPGKDTRTPGKDSRTPSKDTRTPSKDARAPDKDTRASHPTLTAMLSGSQVINLDDDAG